jgi:SOS-response transcriptional repressor LexA
MRPHPRQDQVVNFVTWYVSTYDRSPSYAEIGKQLGISKQAVALLATKLISKGRLARPRFHLGLRVAA